MMRYQDGYNAILDAKKQTLCFKAFQPLCGNLV